MSRNRFSSLCQDTWNIIMLGSKKRRANKVAWKEMKINILLRSKVHSITIIAIKSRDVTHKRLNYRERRPTHQEEWRSPNSSRSKRNRLPTRKSILLSTEMTLKSRSTSKRCVKRREKLQLLGQDWQRASSKHGSARNTRAKLPRRYYLSSNLRWTFLLISQHG